MARNYSLTKAAKRQIAWFFRKRLEKLSYTPTQAVARLYNYPRFAVITDRWCDKLNVTKLSLVHSDIIALCIIKSLYSSLYGSLPAGPIPSWPASTPFHIWEAPAGGNGESDGESDGESNGESEGESNGDGESGGESGENDGDGDGDGDAGAFEKRGEDDGGGDGAGNGERIQSEGRARSDAEKREAERHLRRLNGRHHEQPFETYNNCNKRCLDHQLPFTNQLVGKVRKALRADSMNRVSRFRDSGQLDMKRLTDIAQLTDVTSVYQRTRKGKKLDSCVQIYIDESGSMGAHTEVTDDKGKAYTRMSVAATAAAVVSKSMDQLQIPHQLLAYCSRVRLIKNWRGKWQNSQLESIASTGGTHVPSALEAGVPHMLNRREARKIAIVITDGDLSADDAFYNLGGSLAKMRAKGVEVYAVGLDTQVLCPDPKRPNIDWWGTVGVGPVVKHYGGRSTADRGGKPKSQTVGFHGGIDNVQADTLVNQLTRHLVDVFTQGREVVR